MSDPGDPSPDLQPTVQERRIIVLYVINLFLIAFLDVYFFITNTAVLIALLTAALLAYAYRTFKLSQMAFIVGNRPYVECTALSYGEGPAGPCLVTEFKNPGKSPAHNVSTRVQMQVMKWGEPPGPVFYDQAAADAGAGMIYQGETRRMYIPAGEHFVDATDWRHKYIRISMITRFSGLRDPKHIGYEAVSVRLFAIRQNKTKLKGAGSLVESDTDYPVKA